MAKIGAAVAVATAGLLAGCGGDDGTDELAALAPPDVPFYAEAVIRPEGDQADAIEAFAERVGGTTDPGAALVSRIDASLADEGLDATWSEDIEPWLGESASAFVSSLNGSETPDYAVMAQVDDADAAEDFLQTLIEQDPAEEEQLTYGDTDYYLAGPFAVGIVDESAFVLASETGFKLAVDAAEGESLAESDEYEDELDGLPDDPLASMFFEPGPAIEASIAQGDLDPDAAQAVEPLLRGPLSQPAAAALTATTESASLDIAGAVDQSSPMSTESPLLAELPGGAWFAAAVPDLGETLQHTVDQLSMSGVPGAGELERQVREATGLDLEQDVFSWLGDAAAFVQGTAVPGFSAGLIAETSDPEAPRQALEALQRLAEQDSGLPSTGPPEGAEYGFSIGIPGIGGGAEAGVIGDELVAVFGTTARQALKPADSLGDNPAFQEAVASLGGDLDPGLFVSLPEFFQVAEQGSDGDVDYQALRPYVEALGTLIAGSRVDDGDVRARVTVSLAD